MARITLIRTGTKYYSFSANIDSFRIENGEQVNVERGRKGVEGVCWSGFQPQGDPH